MTSFGFLIQKEQINGICYDKTYRSYVSLSMAKESRVISSLYVPID
jgi:hypothetical protein